MDPLTIASLVGTAGGFISKLFGSADKKPDIAEARQRLMALRTQTLNRVLPILNRQLNERRAAVTQGAAERAAAQGQSANAEAYMNPAIDQVDRAGLSHIENVTEGVNSDYDRALANLETQNAMQPSEPNAGDYLAEGFRGVGQLASTQQYLNTLRGNQPAATAVIPNAPMSAPEVPELLPTPEVPESTQEFPWQQKGVRGRAWRFPMPKEFQ